MGLWMKKPRCWWELSTQQPTRKSYVLNVDFEGNSTNTFVFATRNSVSPDEAAAAYYEYSIVQNPTVMFEAYSGNGDNSDVDLRVSNGSTANTFELVLGSAVVQFKVNVQQDGSDITFDVMLSANSGIGAHGTTANRYVIGTLAQDAAITVTAAGVSYVYNFLQKMMQGNTTLYSAKVRGS